MEEQIIWIEKPSKKFIFYYSFLSFNTSSKKGIGPIGLTFVIIVWIFYFLNLLINPNQKEGADWGVLIVMGIILGLSIIFLLLYNIFLNRSYQYIITNNRVKLIGGVFNKIAKEVPFSQITDINISQNILEKIMGIYELHIQTAGSQSFTELEPKISFLALEDPNTPKKIILEYINR